MDESYLLAAARYVEMNPVAAGMVARPEDYPWSSAQAHLVAKDDKLVKVEPLLSLVGNWKDFLYLSSDEEMNLFRKHERTGRPLGNETFVEQIENLLGRTLRPKKPGPKTNVA
jgi:putative transposase